ncbi:hypothetical protein BU14_0058s0031 [Porphyra umbilicalis]|uniref:Uncharacterized protein n=1 Tax=Porphyra umbilicalis TaxID=2786 RepID=A0A1X6PH35_PORUM|nr:hypothetical protein BU14_0058s0031 [Porphyra umbilicalis]|eukprot:OSX80120.1 hypothetical protein BU14_0058s0031 [Porphyra umbilicalis]
MAFLFAPALATRRQRAGPLPCRRCSPPVGAPRRSRAVMAVPAEAQRAFDRRMNEVCNEVVKTILRGSDADVVALRNRLVESAADFVTPSASPDAAAGDAAAAAWATAAAATATAAAATATAATAAETATGPRDAAIADGAPPPAPPAVDAGVVFHACIVALLDHTLSPAVPTLCGPYARAFEGMVRLVEDAGWQITAPVMKITG